jgi:hypothetical protein
MVLVVGTVIADELLGVLTKVDVDAKKITVIEKDTDKEHVLKTNDDTVQIQKKKGELVEVKVALEKLKGFLEKVQDKGAKGIPVKVTYEKGVASKIEVKFQRKKKAAE